MNTILANSAAKSYTSQFDISAIRPVKQHNTQSIFSVNKSSAQGDDAFQQNVNEEIRRKEQELFEERSRISTSTFMTRDILDSKPNPPASSGATFSTGNSDVSKSSGRIDSEKVYVEKTLAAIKGGASLVDAMTSAKADLFELLFAEELEINGGNVGDAIEKAKINMKMEVSDRELLGIVQDMAEEYKITDPQVAKELETFAAKLRDKIALDEKGLGNLKSAGESDKSSSQGGNTASQVNATSQTNSVSQVNSVSVLRDQFMDIPHSKYQENQRMANKNEEIRNGMTKNEGGRGGENRTVEKRMPLNVFA